MYTNIKYMTKYPFLSWLFGVKIAKAWNTLFGINQALDILDFKKIIWEILVLNLSLSPYPICPTLNF